jgi:TolB-like protein/Tfp pilus assembly protein PilF
MSLFKELKRRNVIRVALAYLVIGWLVLQVTNTLVPILELPLSVGKFIFLLLFLGFFPALLFSWAFEITPEGIKKEKEVVRDNSITNITAKKLDYITLAAAVGVLGLFGYQQMNPTTPNVNVNSIESASESVATLDFNSINADSISNKSIAVLPFANRSNQDDDLFFTDGIHDDLLTQLAKISDMKVISRTSMMQYRDTDKSITEIAEELGVATILEGGVQRAGQRIRINAQLIDVASDEHLWAETYNREMTIENIFDIQSEITKHIVAAVKGQLTSEEKNILEDKPTKSLAAWEAYSKARELIRSTGFNPDAYRAAEPLLQQAVRLDPDFYHAQAKLVHILGLAYWIGYGRTNEVRQAAETAMLRVESIAPGSAEALTARGHYHYRIERDYKSALDVYQQALKAKPGDSEILLAAGHTQRRLGLFDQSDESFLSAHKADPGNVSTSAVLLNTLVKLSKYERVRELLPAARKRFPDEPDLGAAEVMLALQADGDIETARKVHAGVEPNAAWAYFDASTTMAWMRPNLDAVIAVWKRPEIQAFAATDITMRGVRELELAWAYTLIDDQLNAKKWLDEAVAVSTDDLNGYLRAWVLTTLAKAKALHGDFTGATSAAREAINSFPIVDDKWEGPQIHLQAWHALAIAGHRDEALKNIAELLDQPLDVHRWQLYLDPRWDFFRDDERFNKLIKPLNFDESVHAKNKEIK